MSKMLRQTIRVGSGGGGVESSLTGFSTFFYIMSILAASLFVVLFFATAYTTASQSYEASTNYNWAYLAYALEILIAGLFFGVTLKAASDIIRLLKKANDIPYSGRISEAWGKYELVYSCTKCKTKLSENIKKCPNCGSVFDGIEDVTKG